ncbi:MAG: Nif3-like dinuclear metal center hexameric protein [Desulfobacteraceae bacterium]|jgi:dinuclear metal center YbgI/SA1388 family protein
MAAKVSDIVQVMEIIAPTHLAEEWDNVGLQIGDHHWPVKTLAVALDPSLQTVEESHNKNADMLITHHPLLFRPLTAIHFHTPIGSIIQRAVQYQMAIFAAHTNLDKTEDGLNDLFARRIGLQNLKVLQISSVSEDTRQTVNTTLGLERVQGIGRVGDVKQAVELQSLAANIKKELNLQKVKFAGKPDLVITKAAVCTGSGSEVLKSFFASGAQVYISGDLKYHDARDIEAAGLGIIDIGHFASEHIVVAELAKRLETILVQRRLEVDVFACEIEEDPFVMI